MSFLGDGSVHHRDRNIVLGPRGGVRDPFYLQTWLIWNFQDALPTAPPHDSSPFAKAWTNVAPAPLLQTDSADGPFSGYGSSIQIYDGSANFPKRAIASDAGWDFASASQTLTIEGWVKLMPVNGNARVNLIRVGDNGLTSWWWPWVQCVAGVAQFGLDVVGSTALSLPSGAVLNTWMHYVFQHTGTIVYIACNGARLSGALFGNVVWNDATMQAMNTSLGTVVGSGILLGPQRVTLANRYGIDTSLTYTVPAAPFPTS